MNPVWRHRHQLYGNTIISTYYSLICYRQGLFFFPPQAKMSNICRFSLDSLIMWKENINISKKANKLRQTYTGGALLIYSCPMWSSHASACQNKQQYRALSSCWLPSVGQCHPAVSLIGWLDQQMSKHVLILSGQVISSVRCHVVRCLQGLFLLIPACVSFVLSQLCRRLSRACFPPVCVFRCERLEEQLNDLTELHQNEILNLKQELASMEEKIAYQSYERARDIQVCPSVRPTSASTQLMSEIH